LLNCYARGREATASDTLFNVSVKTDCYARGREATGSAGNEEQK
jgi:hypothetical protein